MTTMYRDVLSKKPWWEYTSKLYDSRSYEAKRDDNRSVNMPVDHTYRVPKTQADFLREYYPTSHKIYNTTIYPNARKLDPETGLWYEQPMSRCAFAFQQLISKKHTLHLTGNDMQFEIADGAERVGDIEEYQKMLIRFKKTWMTASMEMVFYQAVNSWNIVADSAVVAYISEGKFGARTLSYLNGDELFPHYDSVTGKMNLFARKYYDYDESGVVSTEWVEIWDSTYLYRFCKSAEGMKTDQPLVYPLPGGYCMNGYYLVSRDKHGFPDIPVAYIRRDAPCWAPVQRNIEDYEEAFSYLCENNKAFGFPIFYAKGDGDSISIGGDMHGSAKYITMNDKDSDAGFLNGTDASSAFATQLEKSYNLIYELSFTVKPPELKSGDLPGVALKLLYSPAIECGMNDAQALQPFVNKLTELVKFGTGYELNKQSDYVNLPVNAWIKVYVHQNLQEEITNIATAVQNGFLSHQTASERCPEFPKNDEYSRVVGETKQKQEQDLLNDIRLDDAQTENEIQKDKETARLNKNKGGSDINTGHGKAGRPNKSGTQWDENRNWPGRDNWDSYDKKH